ncbi:hypothetical protein [Prauserella muralis]|uniref:Uncharacterized protein n=1 Tax=Prauserella muralis TaxID=588067 RepID=A0A2V4B7L7_9PSEU|nr:hypothetical protein [Prauserella muralis]PXY31111.1 hypothetical protein BAY60_01465 [Prauserella muralis]TWE14600.1 hypothetical protein FHX69_6757 [Prauserella muralis]
MGLFGPRRDPEDPRQLQIAVHELGHAFAWKAAGFRIKEIVHEGDSGYVNVRWDDDNLLGYAIGCWGGFEAEDKWMRTHGKRASRYHSSHDIKNFRHVNRALGNDRLSEGKARALARKHINRHYAAILAAAPRLIVKGRLSL